MTRRPAVDGDGWYVDDVRITGESDTPPPTDTLAVSMTCLPDNGTLPFVSQFCVGLTNLTTESRRMAASITVVMPDATQYPNWRAGWTNLSSEETYSVCWNQNLPGLGSLVGQSLFTLYGADVTPAPYNQPPFSPSGDTDSDVCTITAAAP